MSHNTLNYFNNLFQPVRQSRPFRYLWLGQLFSVLGSSISMVILPMVVYALTGSKVVMGTVMAVYMLPYVLMLPVAGLMVDRMNRIGVMVAADAVRCVMMLGMMFLLLQDRMTLPLLYSFMAVYGFMEGLFQPAYSAMRARVFTPDIRNAANALTQVSHQGVRLLGPAIGGLLISYVSAGVGYGIDAITYLISLCCLWFIRDLGTKRLIKSKIGWKSDLATGFIILKGHPWLWITIAVFSVLNIFFSGIVLILVPWLFKIHHGFTPFLYGLGVTFAGVGGVIAALLFGSRTSWRKRGWLAYGGVIISGVALLFLPFVAWGPGLVALMAVEGFGMMLFGLVWETSLQELVPEEAFGRVASIDLLGSFALLPLGYLAVGGLADWIGGQATMVLLALGGLLIAACALWVPAIRNFD
ncbi:MFS transporter [Paenibacillus swuensis]|uniref:MFS transporter n=1 Tax=Paenibacillus swuensis TaxID=1178515 RepID=UPI0038B338D5